MDRSRFVPRSLVAPLALAALLVTPGLAGAQDRRDYPETDVDKQLDESLKREFGKEPRDAEPWEEPAPRTTPAPSAPRSRRSSEDEDDRFKISLGAYAAYWVGQLWGASVAGARNGDHASTVHLDGGATAVANLDAFRMPTYAAWLGLGKYVSIEGGARYAAISDSGRVAPQDFTFRTTTFIAGEPIRTKLQFLTADLNVRVHPLSGRWGRLDILLGARYLSADVEFLSTATPNRAQQKVEALIPMIGLGGVLRPLKTDFVTIELAAHGRAGGFDWSETGYRYRGHNHPSEYVDRSFRAVSLEAEGSLAIILFDCFGITGGYRFELVEIDRRDSGSTKRADWKAGGPFAGVFMQF